MLASKLRRQWNVRCQAWLLNGIPCFNALPIMGEEKLNPTPFIHGYYSVEMLRNTYTQTLQPCNGSNMWAPSEHDPIIALKFKKKKRGYYNFKRRLEEGEIRSRTLYETVSRAGRIVKCPTCGRYGHNKKTCKHKVHLKLTLCLIDFMLMSTHFFLCASLTLC